MKKWAASVIVVLCWVLAVFVPAATAAPQLLPELKHKHYPLRDLVFVDFHNPYFTPMDRIVVNMMVREGTGRNRVIAIGQARLPVNLVLMPGEHTSAKVPIRARVMRDIPALADFEFKITGRPLEMDNLPPDVVVQDSDNGTGLEITRDANNVPYVVGFIGLSPGNVAATSVRVDLAILTFLDANGDLAWSEMLPISGTLTNDETLLVWGKFEQINPALVPDISTVEAKFVVSRKK